MQVFGSVTLRPDGSASLQLRPVGAAPAPQPGPDGGEVEMDATKPPKAREVLNMITDGEIEMHSSRADITTMQIGVMLSNVQRMLNLVPGPNGTWTDDAWARLFSILRGQKRQRQGLMNGLALPAPALPPPRPPGALLELADLLELEDSDSTSTTTKDSTSDSDSDSDSTSVARSIGEPNTAELQTQVAQLTQDKEALEAKVGEMEDTVGATEEWAKAVEEENATLTKENALLKRRWAELGDGRDLGEAMTGRMGD